MAFFDVFNGDADGICSLIQLRLKGPRDSQLITGVKRDIDLLRRVDAREGDEVTVLDISLEKNIDALKDLLDKSVSVFYSDHHAHGEIPVSTSFVNHINTASDTCTSLIVNELLNDSYANWAVTGAFGDNLGVPATKLSVRIGLSETDRGVLQNLGVLINYNGYGSSLDDLHFHPEDLYRHMCKFADPLEFLAKEADVFQRLESGYESDMDQAENAKMLFETDKVAVIQLPNERWARRVSGVFGNQLANEHPGRAHAILTEQGNGSFLVSLRAPLDKPHYADVIAKSFPSGGGRRRAAGINKLGEGEVGELISLMETHYS